jgi:type VI secretion system protein ImpA
VAHDIGRFAGTMGGTDAAAEELEPEAEAEPGSQGPASSGRASRQVTAASLTAVTNRADAVRLLELVVQYYRQYEPSSPLPLLIERARRLADKSFIEILRDMAPDGLNQAQNIAGAQNE